MKRSRLLVIISVIAFSFSLAGSAGATTVSAVWTSLNGSSIPETTALDAVVGDTAQLDLRVAADAAGVHFISESLSYDTALLDADLIEICPAAPGNASAGFCGELAFGDLLTQFTNPTIDDPAGEVVNIVANAGFPGGDWPDQANTTFTLARVDFTITAEGFSVVTPFFRLPGALDGAIDGSGNIFIPAIEGATLTAIPEPSTVLLFAGGLLALGLQRRGRSQ